LLKVLQKLKCMCKSLYLKLSEKIFKIILLRRFYV
jgi:hypothetical protein